MKHAYIAGPMSTCIDFNFPAFYEAEGKLVCQGYKVFNPAREDIYEWGSLEEVKKHATYRHCLRKDINYLLSIDPKDMTIFLLKGWEESKGVAVELALAKAVGIKTEVL